MIFYIYLSIIILIIIVCYILYQKENYSSSSSKLPLNVVHYVLYDYMKLLNEICTSNHLVYWADSGTLLGAVRDKGIIPHDDDIDLCMFEKDIHKLQKIIQTDYPDYSLYLYTEINKDYWPIYKFTHKSLKDNVFIDIFAVQKEHKENEPVIIYKEQKNKNTWPLFYYKESELWPLQPSVFGKLTIWIPNNSVPYLNRAYGDWKTPVVYERH